MPGIHSNTVLVEFPARISGTNPSELINHLQWVAARDKGDCWQVRLNRSTKAFTLERAFRRENITKAGVRSAFRSLPPHDEYLQMDRAELDELISWTESKAGEIQERLFAAKLKIMTALDAELCEAVRSIMQEWLLDAFPSASTWVIHARPVLLHRTTLPRALLQIEEDPGLFDRGAEGFDGFQSAAALADSISFGLDDYFAPLFLSLAPDPWGMSVGRAHGVIAITFGCCIEGCSGLPAEPIQLFQDGRNIGPTVEECSVAPKFFEDALEWWTKGLNRLFTEVSDPCRYQRDGKYRPRGHFETLLTIEQIFRSVRSISAGHRDFHARRTLLFDTLDTIQGLKYSDFERMCTLSKAEKCLQELEEGLPESVAVVLLPRARLAVEALRQLQDGFFLSPRVSDEGVLLDRGVIKSEKAVAKWLRVIRNAGHGFTPKGISQSQSDELKRDEILLTVHNGRIPPKLPDLAYLYLLWLIQNPECLRFQGSR